MIEARPIVGDPHDDVRRDQRAGQRGPAVQPALDRGGVVDARAHAYESCPGRAVAVDVRLRGAQRELAAGRPLELYRESFSHVDGP